MRILFIGASNIGRGGRSTIAYNLSKYLDNKCECDFFCDGGIKPISDIILEIQNKNGYVFTDKVKETNYFKRQIIWFGRLRNVFKQQSYDIVHINVDHSVEAVRAILGCKIFGAKKIIIHAHTTKFMMGTGTVKRLLARIIRPLLLILSDAQLACSQKAAEFMYGKKTANSGKIILINNGIDIEKYKYDSEVRYKLRNEYSLNDKFVIGHVGNFYYPKNHERVINIFKKIHEKNLDAVLLLVGDGELRETIYQKVVREKLEEHVIFLGTRDDVFQWLQVFDVFILPSFFEGVPIAGIEAQAADLPCFFSDTITREAQLTENVEYISLNKTDDEWADKILNTISKKRTDNSQKIITEGFDIRKSADKLYEVYCKVLDG